MIGSAGHTEVKVNVMGPLLISTPGEWDDFYTQLSTLKAAGVNGISTDIWWGLVEAKGPGIYDWEVYRRMALAIRSAGLRWIPVLSLHRLGGNVGDPMDRTVRLPPWIWSRSQRSSDLKFRSEQGNESDEYVAFWSDALVKDDYRRLMDSFQRRFADFADIIDEVNLSLGPSGELRYPSYNSHDSGTGYPTRGALQAYSGPAIESFRAFALKKYGSLAAINSAWSFRLSAIEQIFPPSANSLSTNFWNERIQFSNFGKDFFDWYNQSLTDHADRMLGLAQSVFSQPDSAFHKVQISGKVPGVHWRMAIDRAAELAAGLIRTSDQWTRENGYGYLPVVSTFARAATVSPVTLHFTALEMDDDGGGDTVGSKAKTLSRWIGEIARRLNVEIKGENALAGELGSRRAWQNLFEAVSVYGYQGLTLLRSDDIVHDPNKLRQLTDFITELKPQSTCEAKLTNHN